MTKTSKKRILFNRKPPVDERRGEAVSQYTCEHCTKRIRVGCNGFDRYIGRLSDRKSIRSCE